MTTCTSARIEAWQAKLLCRRYLTARFDSVSIRATDVEGIPGNFTVVWGLGCLSDGALELLGAWPVSTADPDSWMRVANDLSARGLERVTYLWANEPFPAVTRLSELLTQFAPFLPMPTRRRSAFRKLDDAAHRLRRRLGRSVARHGLFSGPQDVATFVAETLRRAENDLDAVEPRTSSPSRAAQRIGSPISIQRPRTTETSRR